MHLAATAEEARDVDPANLPQGRRQDRDQGQVDDRRGDRPQRRISRRRASTPVETDLGEYIIQLRGEMPSHIIAPAVHLNKDQVESDFRRVHTRSRPEARPVRAGATLLTEARGVLRERFLAADVGITGANFLVAETGTSIIVTNEGNGDLTQILPKVAYRHRLDREDRADAGGCGQILRVLARSATGQEHVRLHDLLDRAAPARRSRRAARIPCRASSTMAARRCSAREFQEMLRCIRCGACMNHCPVYHAVGGHAYGWVYPGPMGAVLTPTLIGVDKAGHLPNASTFCGRCESVCPVSIPCPS